MSENGWLDSFRHNLDLFLSEETRNRVLEGSEHIPDASAEETSRWLKGVVERLDLLVDQPTRTRIMQVCGHECAEMNREEHVDPMIAKRREFDSLDDYLDAEQQNPTPGYRIVRERDVITVYYNPRAMNVRCYCSLWHGLSDDEKASLTWCGCARGFLEKVWEGILERPAEVEVLESTIAGAQECKFAVHL